MDVESVLMTPPLLLLVLVACHGVLPLVIVLGKTCTNNNDTVLVNEDSPLSLMKDRCSNLGMHV